MIRYISSFLAQNDVCACMNAILYSDIYRKRLIEEAHIEDGHVLSRELRDPR